MRKRLVIGAMAVVVIGVATYVLSQPKKGSVEYHKNEYLKAYNSLISRGWVDANFVPGMVRRSYWNRRDRQLAFHQRALLDAGYLTEAVFTVSNSQPLNVAHTLRMRRPSILPDYVWNFVLMRSHETNAMTVVVPTEMIEKVGQAIREADLRAKRREDNE